MRLRVLGASGGIGDGLATTAFLLGEHVLIDAGSGLACLDLATLAGIDHVFLTHAHFDHIAGLPMLLDSVQSQRSCPLILHALPETIQALRQHIFNWQIWPDFSALPDPRHPSLVFSPLQVGQPQTVDEFVVTAVPACHSVPAVGYQMDCGAASIVYSGDTSGCSEFWQVVNAIPHLKALVMESAFPDQESALAQLSQHLCPARLKVELAQLQQSGVEICLTHFKPIARLQIAEDLQMLDRPLRLLQAGDVIEVIA